MESPHAVLLVVLIATFAISNLVQAEDQEGIYISKLLRYVYSVSIVEITYIYSIFSYNKINES